MVAAEHFSIRSQHYSFWENADAHTDDLFLVGLMALLAKSDKQALDCCYQASADVVV